MKDKNVLKRRAVKIGKILDEYFPEPEIPLSHFSPYSLLIAVLLSARSTDRMVNRITPKLFERASTAREMLTLSYEEIREFIKPCGLSPQKAKSILALSEILVKEYEGMVPKSFKELEALPGVGHKTASVVMTQAFHIPAFPVDTHIFRLARRWGLSQGKNVKKVEEDLKKLWPEKDWGKVHLQMIYYARSFCPAKRHIINSCPICMLVM